MQLSFKFLCSAVAASCMLSVCFVGNGYADSAVTRVIPYKVIHVDQDYQQSSGMGVKTIASLNGYMGGAYVAGGAAFTNNTSTDLWLVQALSKNQAIVGLAPNATVALPNSTWTALDPENLYVAVLNCPTKPSGYTPGHPLPAGCTQICNSTATAPQLWNPNTVSDKVPYGSTTNTVTFQGDGSSTTQCAFQAGPSSLPNIEVEGYTSKGSTGAAADDALAQDLVIDSRDNSINLHSAFNAQEYAALASSVTAGKVNNCAFYPASASANASADPSSTHRILCKYDLHRAATQYKPAQDAILQILVQDSIRAVSPVELAAEHATGAPNYNEIEVGSNDISGQGIALVDLDQYFKDPSESGLAAANGATITASAETTQLAIPGAKDQAPISTTVTFTGHNITQNTMVSIRDNNEGGNHLSLSSTSCNVTPVAPQCTLSVSANSTDKVGGSDSLSFFSSSVEVVPSSITFDFVSKLSVPPTTPTVTFSPNPVAMNVGQSTSFIIKGNGFGASDVAKVNYMISDSSIADINDGYHSNKGVCALSADDDFECDVILAGVKLGKKTIQASIIPEQGTFPSSSQTIPVQVAMQSPLQVNYTFNAAKVGGPNADNDPAAIAHITSIGKVAYDGAKYFTINANNHTLNIAKGAPDGVYQINIKATALASPSQHAFNTFYVLVGPNLNYQNWLQGKVTPFNVDNLNGQPLTSVYTDSAFIHALSTDGDVTGLVKDYKQYGDDVNYVNNSKDYLQATSPVNNMVATFPGPQYLSLASGMVAPAYWTIPTDNVNDDIIQQVTDTGNQVLGNGVVNFNWLPTLISGIRSGNQTSVINPSLYLTPNLYFGSAVQQAFATYNPEQLGFLADTIMQYADDSKSGKPLSYIAGVDLYLQMGTSNADADAFKAIADHLAYQGLTFGYYEFADKAFQPSIINAMGPLGIANISTYDVGTNRASISDYNTAAPNVSGGFGSTIYNNIFQNSISCGNGFSVPGSVYMRASWCNVSTNDATAANKIAWSGNDASVSSAPDNSPKANMRNYNGNFSIVLPLSATSTDYSYLELINPDFSALLASNAGFAVTNNASGSTCSSLSQRNLDDKDWSSDNISNCLLGDKQFTINGKNYAFVNFNHCVDKDGNAYPYYQCILVSANISGKNDGSGFISDSSDQATADEINHPSQADYLFSNVKAFDATNPNLVGYSLYSLQNAGATGPQQYLESTTTNTAVQEPINMALNATNDAKGATMSSCTEALDSSTPVSCDPFYYSSANATDTNVPDPHYIVSQAWKAFAKLQLTKPNISG